MLNEEQKRFLQYLLHCPLMSVKELQKKHAICFELDRVADLNEIRSLIRILNENLKTAQLAIKSRLCEDSNEEHFVLLSLTETEAAKHVSKFSQPEIDLLKHILKEIVASETGTLSSIDCINFTSTVSKLGKSDAQKALDKFLSSKWLKEKEGEVSFTVRALMELEPLLRKIDNELADCKLCGSLAVKGVHCPSCHAKVHRFCLSRISRASSTLKCPTCHKQWSSFDEPFNPSQSSEATARSSQSQCHLSDSQAPASSDSSSGRRRRTRRLADSDDSD